MNFDETEVLRRARMIQTQEARREYLDQACPDASTRDRIERLLAQDRNDSLPVESPTLDDNMSFEPMAVQMGTTIGPYLLIEPIGEGGMGAVFLAEQVEPVKRRVAIKLIKTGNAIGEVIARFEAERQALALMEHPNIAQFFDAGTTDSGNPYFVMEFVPGISVTHYCDQERLSIDDRLVLFRKICNAVSHAHQKSIIHRDLKPSNILVTVVDGEPIPKIIDFGLAKATGAQLAVQTRQTNFGQVLGTLQYMSPEQTTLSSADIDTRSDIYSLGTILYQLLVGTPPFEIDQITERALDEVFRMIREQDPPTPNQRFGSSKTNSEIAGRRRIDVEKMKRLVKGDLEWIIMRSLEKQRTRRYQSVDAFSADIQRFIEFKPVEARPPSFIYRTRRFLQRNLAATLVVTGILATTIVGIVIANSLVNRTRIAAQAQGLVDSLIAAEVVEIPRIIEQLDACPNWAKKDLQHQYNNRADDSNAKVYAALALLGNDASVLAFLEQRLLTISADQFAIVRGSLFDSRSHMIDEYWAMALDRRQDPDQRFRAAGALALYDSENTNWNATEFTQFLADHFVKVLPSELLPWRNVFRPVKHQLIGPLTQVYGDKSKLEKARLFAAVTLADYLDQDVDSVFELLAESELWQFPILFTKIEGQRIRAIELGNAEIDRESLSTLTEVEREIRNTRKANSAAMLCRLGATEKVWTILKASPDPGARSYLIHWMSPSGVDPNLILDRINVETDVTIKRALIQSLGQFDRSRIPERDQANLVDSLVSIYRTAHDAGLHSSAQWLLQAWGQANRLEPIDLELRQNEIQLKADGIQKRQWYLNSRGQTFVIVDAKEFQMGSPETERRRPDEAIHHRKIERRIAVSTTSVTIAQWQEFAESVGLDETNQRKFRPKPDSDAAPITAISWYDAVRYCNWLSEREDIEKAQWCYEPNQEGKYSKGMRAKDKFWELDGYRLPTEAEWEYVSRAAAHTSRFFGQSDSMVSNYAWHTSNSNGMLQPVAVLKPNGFGLFDIQGNAWNWCYDAYEPYPLDQRIVSDDHPGTEAIDETVNRVMRGGGYYSQSINVRAAMRTYAQPGDFRNFNVGLRPVKTFRLNK